MNNRIHFINSFISGGAFAVRPIGVIIIGWPIAFRNASGLS